MASTNEIFGQIGAAKLFAGTISNSINTKAKISDNSKQEDELNQQLENSTDNKEREYIRKKIKRIQKKNKLLGTVDKVVDGATNLLIKLAEYCDIGKNAIIQWISTFIVGYVPILEVAVKGVLLSNLKKMTSCSIDPRIPDSWRTDGVYINEKEIDPRRILETSPFSKYGKYNYSGIFSNYSSDAETSLYTLPRAEDMNAFLWFSKNCANFVSPNIIPSDSGITGIFDVDDSSTTLYNGRYFYEKEGHKFLPGSSFKQKLSSNTIFLCTDKVDDIDGTVYEVLPVSESWTSINWYKNKSNPNKEKPLFNIEYSNNYSTSANLPKNNFKFKILPKPFQISFGYTNALENNISTMSDMVDKGVEKVVGVSGTSETDTSSMVYPGIVSLSPKMARFNADGVYSKNGRYSVREDRYYVTLVDSQVSGTRTYKLIPKTGRSESEKYLLYYTKQNKFVIASDINGTPCGIDDLSDVLTECYCGKTVYEFNYDYIMSFKMFDTQTIAANIVNKLMNINIPFKKNDNEDTTLSNTDQIYIDNYVDKLVEHIISNEEKEYTDCFYNFSNEEYKELEEATNTKAINNTLSTSTNTTTEEVFNVLDSYNADASLQSKTETISRALTLASDATNNRTIQDTNSSTDGIESNEEDSASSFIEKAVKCLTSEIVNAILTPKVLMLIQINKKLMNNDPLNTSENYSFSVEDILGALQGILSGIIKEIIDTIQKELLRVILSAIGQIFNAYLKELALEYANKWVTLLKQILSCFKYNKNSLNGNTNNDSVYGAINAALDEIDSADIDTLVDQIMPNTNNC